MGKWCVIVCSLLFFSPLFHGGIAVAAKAQEGSEAWGYVQSDPRAIICFWWLYKSPYRVEDPSKPWPIILWLQGGPGASGVGIGNFQEIGPLDARFEAAEFNMDNPVGTGYSFVEDEELFVKTDEEAGTDLTTVLMAIFNKDESLQKSPLYIVAESYGGKYAVTLALAALRAIEAGKLKLKLGGVALGDSWISPEDFVFSWGPLLKDVSRLDNNGLQKSNSVAQKIKQRIEEGQYLAATNLWMDLESVIRTSSNHVDIYNFLLDSGSGSSSTTATELSKGIALRRYSRYLSSLRATPGGVGDVDFLMNGVIKKKLKIPENVTWGGQSDSVFLKLAGDFMKPRIAEVDELLAKGVNVTVYNGQLDVICATKGTEAWIEKLNWSTKGFTKSYKNLHFYWILGAGHFVPVEQPCVALNMVGVITQSPAASA
ncbi:Serine carboxypeptidase-like 51 [Morella rubra]|uniref:Carboxypeptidase n=1 Tax=Morella rubra TaxID=262757 RepID=A0A6A1WQD7_9ROSI|nr:Serine carboxypeptidase-like 51 [Morella rubra]